MTTNDIPSYLAGYEETHADDPREAAIEWFRDADYGLFMHYGLYSLLGNHEWVQYNEEIPPGEYALLQDYFTAENFDAGAIVDLAVDAGMDYVNLTSKHHEGFCLFDSDWTTYTSADAPAGRDLVGELAEACDDAGLGLFLYYSHGIDWRHPHAPNNDDWGTPARPDYDDRPGIYADAGHDLERYLDYAEAQIVELLENYGPIAGIWLDLHSVPDRHPERLHLEELYGTIRDRQPQTLISYKYGITGTEDFVAPEHEAEDGDPDKPTEICTTMIPSAEYGDEIGVSWGYLAEAEGKHKDAGEVWDALAEATRNGHNLLLNTGPLPDGAIDPEDEAVFREVGARIREEGLPDGG
jgi:alpha-L-fucosidase